MNTSRRFAGRRRDDLPPRGARTGQFRLPEPPPMDPDAALRSVLDALPACFALFTGFDHSVEFVNPAMAAHWQGRALVGQTLDRAFPEIARTNQRKEWDEALRSGSRRDLQEMALALPTADGSVRAAWFDFTLMPRVDARGATYGVSLFGLEVTERVRAREEMFAIVTHEIKTPLATVGLKLDLLARNAVRCESLPAADVRASLEVARRQIQRLATLTDNMLDVARVANGRLQLDMDDMDLSAVAREVAERFGEHARRATCVIALELTEPLPGRWDRVRLEQVVSNLVSNALKYGEGRTVRIRTARDGDDAVLEVIDQGIGIELADQRRIFERFVRTADSHRVESLGLGLFVVRELVRAHGGDVTVQSSPGAGSTFRVRLPMRTDAGTRR